MKKNLFIAAMSLLVLAGCSSNEDEIDNIIANSDNAITFDTYVGKVTKASVPGEFGVFAYESTWNVSSSTSNFMFNQKVKIDGTYDPIKYWPGRDVSFIAYYPFQASVEGIALKNYTNTTPGLPSMDFSIGDNAGTDLLVSNLEKNKTSGTIPLTLKHALSRITFTISNPSVETGTSVALKSIQLTNMKNSGVLTFGETAPSWNTASGTSEAFTVKAQGTPHYMIPQVLASIKAEITYTVTTTDAALPNGKFETDKVIEVDLATTDITDWEPTKQYNYTITPTLNKVIISASMEEWNTPAETVSVPQS